MVVSAPVGAGHCGRRRVRSAAAKHHRGSEQVDADSRRRDADVCPRRREGLGVQDPRQRRECKVQTEGSQSGVVDERAYDLGARVPKRQRGSATAALLLCWRAGAAA